MRRLVTLTSFLGFIPMLIYGAIVLAGHSLGFPGGEMGYIFLVIGGLMTWRVIWWLIT